MKGKRFGRLTVVALSKYVYLGRKKKHRYNIWACICDCGNTVDVRDSDLRRGKTLSCKCLRKENITKHGLYKHPVYSVWSAMKDRCANKNAAEYKNYGGRGITVCGEWNKFESFWEDMSSGYERGKTLDRIDVNGNYSKENCRWVSNLEQQNNRRDNRMITYMGKTQSMASWSRELKIKYTTIQGRLRLNWPTEKLLSKPNHRDGFNYKSSGFGSPKPIS